MKFLIEYTDHYGTPIQGYPNKVGIIEADSFESAAKRLGLSNPDYQCKWWASYQYENKYQSLFPMGSIKLQNLSDITSNKTLDNWMHEEQLKFERRSRLDM